MKAEQSSYGVSEPRLTPTVSARCEKFAAYYRRQLQKCADMLTQSGVPEWVENTDSDGVPANRVPARLKWYLARRKDVTPSEAEPQLQAEMRRSLADVIAYDKEPVPFNPLT